MKALQRNISNFIKGFIKKVRQKRKTQSTSLVLLLVILSIVIITPVQSISSVPLQFDSFPYLQSGTVQITPNSTSSSYISASSTYTFQKALRVKPNSNNIFIGTNSIDYQLNKVSQYNDFYLYWGTGLSIVDNTRVTISISYSNRYINTIKVSILVISPDFFYTDIYSTDYLFYNDMSLVDSTNVTNTTFSVTLFLTYCEIETMNSGNGEIGVAFDTMNITSSLLTIPILLYGNIYYAYFTYRLIVWYPTVAKTKYNIIIQALYVEGISSYQYGFTKYNTTNSIFFMALAKFYYSAVKNQSNPGFTWSHSIGSNSTHQLVIKTTLDDQFTDLTHVYILINRLICPLTHPIRGTNKTSGLQECFDDCYDNEFIEFLSTDNYYKCISCTDPLCKTCQSSTKCSSCVVGYDLVEITQSCSLNGGYYDDGSGDIYLCSNSLVGCMNCTSDGATCNVCYNGYYLSSGSCTQCSTITAQCTTCSATQCLSCIAPKVLINATLCADPIPDWVPSKPSLPCTDSKCFSCSSTNISQCLICISDLYRVFNGKCKAICGDGIIVSDEQICDDFNTKDNDGCSSDCQKIQQNFNCDLIPNRIISTMFTSKCYYTKVIQLSLQGIYKHPKENTVNILLKNHQPQLEIWTDINKHKELTQMFRARIDRFDEVDGYWFQYQAKFVKGDLTFIDELKSGSQGSYDKIINQKRLLQQSQTQVSSTYSHILLQLSYSLSQYPLAVSTKKQSLNHQQLSITFNPTLSQHDIFASPNLQFSLSFPLITQNNHLIQYYDQKYYQYSMVMFYLGFMVSICGFVMVGIGVVSYCVDGRNSRGMLLALETIGVGQLTYFSILQIGELNPFFIQLLNGLKWINGYDITISQINQQLDKVRETKGLNIQSLNLSNNVNIPLIMILCMMIVGAILLIIDRCKHKKIHYKQQLDDNIQCNEMNSNNNDQERIIYQQNASTNRKNANTLQPSGQNNSQNILQNTKNNQPLDQEQHKQSRIFIIGNFLLFNLALFLFMLFLYKFTFFVFIQIRFSLRSITIIDIVIGALIAVMIVFFMVFACAKFNAYDKIMEKINDTKSPLKIQDLVSKHKTISQEKLTKIQRRFDKFLQLLPQNEKLPSIRQLFNKRINIKFWYLITFTIEHILNMSAIVIMPQIGKDYINCVAIILYVLIMIFFIVNKPYKGGNLYRLYGTLFVGIIIQSLLLARSILANSITSVGVIGRQQPSIGIYVPFSIGILLLILQAVALAFAFYSIRKIRCCQLEIEWERIQISQIIRIKLNELMTEECGVMEDNDDQKNLKNEQKIIKNNNKKQVSGENENENKKSKYCQNEQEEQSHMMFNNKKNHLNWQDSSFNSTASIPFFKIPLNIHKQVMGIHKMMTNGSSEDGSAIRKNSQMDYSQREINREITSKQLKKQIKEKLLNSKIERKIMLREGVKNEQLWNVKDEKKQIVRKCSETDYSWQQQPSTIQKASKKHILTSKPKQKRSTQKDTYQQVNLYDTNGQNVDYLYTDAKVYNVYEEFDMI